MRRVRRSPASMPAATSPPGGGRRRPARPRRALDERRRTGPRGRRRRSPATTTPYDDTPYFWSDQFGLRLQHVGHAETLACRRARRRRRLLHRALQSTATAASLSALAANRAPSSHRCGGSSQHEMDLRRRSSSPWPRRSAVNVLLLGYGADRHDPVGRLSPVAIPADADRRARPTTTGAARPTTHSEDD